MALFYFIVMCVLVTESCPTLVTPWTVVCQAPLSMGFSRQEYWSGLPYSPSGILLTQGLNLHLLHWQADSLPLSHLGRPQSDSISHFILGFLGMYLL